MLAGPTVGNPPPAQPPAAAMPPVVSTGTAAPPLLLSPAPALPRGVRLECVSIHTIQIEANAPSDANLMVDRCPDTLTGTPTRRGGDSEDTKKFEDDDDDDGDLGGTDWAARCKGQDATLPPVSDLVTGVVYSNEHCAACNGILEFLAWHFFIVLNSTQKLSIFVAFLCTRKVFNQYHSLVCRRRSEGEVLEEQGQRRDRI